MNKIDAREQALSCQIERVQTEIDTLTARLGELSEAIEHLRITRKTLLTLADEPDVEPVAVSHALPSWLLGQTAGHAQRLVGDGFSSVGARGYH